MAYRIIPELCTGCGSCESECPNRAITHKKKLYKINPDKCRECKDDHPKPMCVSLCATKACVPA